MGALTEAIERRRHSETHGRIPWVCRSCGCVNYPETYGTPRAECHGCGKGRFPVRVQYIGGKA